MNLFNLPQDFLIISLQSIDSAQISSHWGHVEYQFFSSTSGIPSWLGIILSLAKYAFIQVIDKNLKCEALRSIPVPPRQS
jgi:hypothetical protein